MRRLAPMLVLAAAAALVLSACGGDAPPAGPVVQDSAGIRIVTNPGSGAWAPGEAWALEEELRIGVQTGDPELQFGMVAGVDVTDDGRIVMVDQQARRVRVFGADGALEHAFGRGGGGPGELSQSISPATGVFIDAEGAIVIPDLMNARLARFALDGTVLDSPLMTMEDGIPMLFRSGPDRSIIVQRRRMEMAEVATTNGAEPTDVVVRLDPGSADGEELATFPAGGTFSMGTDGLPRFRIFSPEPVWAVLTDGRVVRGTNDVYALSITGGETPMIVRRDMARQPVSERTERQLRDLFADAFEQQGVPAEMMGPLLQGVNFEPHWPSLASVLSGPDGTLWVQRIDPDEAMEELTIEDFQSGNLGSRDWDVFDAEGTYLGVVGMPEGVVPFRFRGSHLYGVHHDEVGVQRVVRLRLNRGS
jgi:hypothetical protein